MPDKSIVLTFDYGLFDFFTTGFPLLEKHSFPATVFLTTGIIH